MIRSGFGLLVLLVLSACASDPTPVPEPSGETTGADESPPDNEPADEDEPLAEPAEPSPRCHVSCCSAAVLEMQAQSDDPSIQNECCFCDE